MAELPRSSHLRTGISLALLALAACGGTVERDLGDEGGGGAATMTVVASSTTTSTAATSSSGSGVPCDACEAFERCVNDTCAPIEATLVATLRTHEDHDAEGNEISGIKASICAWEASEAPPAPPAIGTCRVVTSAPPSPQPIGGAGSLLVAHETIGEVSLGPLGASSTCADVHIPSAGLFAADTFAKFSATAGSIFPAFESAVRVPEELDVEANAIEPGNPLTVSWTGESDGVLLLVIATFQPETGTYIECAAPDIGGFYVDGAYTAALAGGTLGLIAGFRDEVALVSPPSSSLAIRTVVTRSDLFVVEIIGP